MSNPIGGKFKFVQLIPANPSEVPSGSLFIDITNANAITYKDPIGNSGDIGGGGGGTNYFVKMMQASEVMPVKSPVSKLPNGKIIAASTDEVSRQNICGYTLEAVTLVDQVVSILLIGPNLQGAIEDLGFTPGEAIYLNEFGGYTNDPADIITGQDLIQVGIADCQGGTASGVAVDLIAFTDIVGRA